MTKKKDRKSSIVCRCLINVFQYISSIDFKRRDLNFLTLTSTMAHCKTSTLWIQASQFCLIYCVTHRVYVGVLQCKCIHLDSAKPKCGAPDHKKLRTWFYQLSWQMNVNWPPWRDSKTFESLYGGQFILSTQLIKPNYLVILPWMQHHSFFRNLPPLYKKLTWLESAI